jgi:hypothetical protein
MKNNTSSTVMKSFHLTGSHKEGIIAPGDVTVDVEKMLSKCLAVENKTVTQEEFNMMIEKSTEVGAHGLQTGYISSKFLNEIGICKHNEIFRDDNNIDKQNSFIVTHVEAKNNYDRNVAAKAHLQIEKETRANERLQISQRKEYEKSDEYKEEKMKLKEIEVLLEKELKGIKKV